MTFSINTGGSEESISYFLVGTNSNSAVDYILDTLKDNVDKEISPQDLRNSVLSLFSSVPFKETGTGTGSRTWIGIDTINPNGRDLKERKIVIGKRGFQGSEIMSQTLLNSDVDLFIYNTKSDSVLQNSTQILLLAGSNLTLHSDSPKIQSQIISGTTESRSLDLINPFGDIKVESETGDLSISGINFPTISESSASASSNKTLMYEDGKLAWSDIIIPATSSLGSTSSPINISGNVLVNNYPIDFTSTDRIPFQFNDINIGETFSQYSSAELLRRMIYPYLPPQCSISLLSPYASGYVEVGTYPTPTIAYSITKRSESTTVSSLQNMIPGVYPAITGFGEVVVNSTSNGIVISPITDASTEFRITVSDGQTTASASTYITGIYPYFYGYSELDTMTNIGLGDLTKIAEYKSDKTIDLVGIGNFFFIYDFDYGTLSTIYDEVGNNIIGSFSATDSLFSSPTGLWAGKKFWVYKWVSSQIGPPSENYTFNF